jgi:tetratricopeptide (TPR) repeat protein
MAPFIIKHPKLIHKWIDQFEKALNKIKKITFIEKDKFEKYISLLQKAQMYLSEVITNDELQKEKNNQAIKNLKKIINHFKNMSVNEFNWLDIINFAENNVCFDAQEIMKVQIIELYPDIADPLAENMSISDDQYIITDSTVGELISLIEQNYDWAININFNDTNKTYLFWYVSEEKLEPRLGERYNEPGAEVEQPLGIGKIVYELYQFIKSLDKKTLSLTIAEFLLLYPEYRGIVRRIQTLSNFKYGEVKDNILSKDVLPINMLRFKLSFFGASRFDPKSDRWLRISFFAGAPYFADLNKENVDKWGFATMNSYN